MTDRIIKIKTHPNINLTVNVTDQMVKDYRECYEMATSSDCEDCKNCDSCLWCEMIGWYTFFLEMMMILCTWRICWCLECIKSEIKKLNEKGGVK